MNSDQHMLPSDSAKTHLRTIIWLSILSLVAAYIGGMIHFGIVYLNNLSESAAIRIESHIHEQTSELVTEVLLSQRDAVQERLQRMEEILNRDPHVQNLCIVFKSQDNADLNKWCSPAPAWNRESQIFINSGSHTLGSLTLHYTLTGVFSKLFATIAPILVFVIAIAICVIFAIFRTAERIVIGPFADAIRKTEQQDATHKAIRMLAHDVRRPFSMLAIMLGEVKEARSMEEVTLLSNRYHTTVHKALNDITRQLNEFLITKKEKESFVSTSLAALIKNAAESVHFIFKSHRQPDLILNDPDALISCIPNQLTRVFENILANAYEACGLHGTIKINLDEENGWYSLSIANTGPQIPEIDLPQLFMESYTKGKSNGHGLGLAIAKLFIERNHGTIHCENIPTGGVVFRMKFPKIHLHHTEFINLSAAGQQLVHSHLDRNKRGKSLKLLIVEDEMIYQDALLLCVDRLKLKGFRIIPMLAQSSDDALRFVHEWQPNAVICDQNLGDGSLSGIEIAKIIHTRYPYIPVLLLSNGIIDSSVHFQNNMTTAVQKPIDTGTMELFLQTLRISTNNSGSQSAMSR